MLHMISFSIVASPASPRSISTSRPANNKRVTCVRRSKSTSCCLSATGEGLVRQIGVSRVAALLERKGLSPGVRLERAWRNAFISGETPEQAADRAEVVQAHNTRTTFERQKKRR